MPPFHCPQCGQSIHADETRAGAVTCPACGGEVLAPAAPASAGSTAPAWHSPSPTPPPSRPSSISPPPLQGFGAPPARGGRTGAGSFFTSPVLWVSIFVAVILFTMLGVFGWWAVGKIEQKREQRVAEARAENEAMSDVGADLQKIAAESRDADGLPRQMDLQFKSNPSAATNDGERMREMMRSFFNDMIKLQNDYISALEKSGFMTFLDPDRMAQDEGLKESHAILERASKVVHDFRGRADEVMKGLPKRFDEHYKDSPARDAARASFERGLSRSAPNFREAWDIEVAVVGHMGELLKLLVASQGHWGPEGGQFAFERDEDIEAFDKIMEKIDAGIARQDEIRSNTMTKINSATAPGGVLGPVK